MSAFNENEAAYYLENYQQQIDEEGIMVGVSRQALDEVLNELVIMRTEKLLNTDKLELLAILKERCLSNMRQLKLSLVDLGIEECVDEIDKLINEMAAK